MKHLVARNTLAERWDFMTKCLTFMVIECDFVICFLTTKDYGLYYEYNYYCYSY